MTTTIYLKEITDLGCHAYSWASGPDDWRDAPGERWESVERWLLPDGWSVTTDQSGLEVALVTPDGEACWIGTGCIIPHSSGRPQVISLRSGCPVLEPAP